MSTEDRWEYRQASDLYLKRWGSEAVLYDNRSGDTHLISHMGLEILNFIKRNQSSSQTGLLAFISDLYNELPIDQQTIAIERHLEVFEDMGFIERKKS